MNTNTFLRLAAALGTVALFLCAVVFFLLGRLMGQGMASDSKPQGPDVPAPTPAPASTLEEKGSIGERFTAFARKPCPVLGSWPGFRGARRDNISAENVALAERWPDCGPRMLWAADLGEGYGGAAVQRGRVYVSDYDQELKEESLRCFSLEDGKEIWRRSHRVQIPSSHGVCRTVPAVTDKYAVSIGPRCDVLCVDAESGALKWGLDLVRDYGADVPLWYTGQCALIDGDIAVLAPAGSDVLLMGVDCESGKVVWKTPNRGGFRMSHSSVMPMTLNGKMTYVYGAEWGKVVAVSAERENLGELLWVWPGLGKQMFIPSPVHVGDGRIFVTSMYGAGSALIRAVEAHAGHEAATVWRHHPGESLACDIHTPILHDGLLYGIQSSDGGAGRNQFVCMNPFQDGKVVWSTGQERRFSSSGPFLLADGKFLLLDGEGILTLARAGATMYEELARFKVPDWRDARAPLALAGGLLILRDEKRMICLDLRD